jgi:hypothetical protein
MGKKKKVQLDLFKADTTWFHVFHELIKSKSWAGMSSPAKIIYVTAKAFVNWKSGTAFPSLDTLEEYSGLSRPSVTKALKELGKLGHLRAEKSPGKKTIYSLVEKFNVTDEDGRPQAVASFDYLPGMVRDATTELKNFLAEGMTSKDGKLQYIHIEHLTLNIAGRDIVETQNNLEMGKEAARAIRERLEGRKTVRTEEVLRMLAEGVDKNSGG